MYTTVLKLPPIVLPIANDGNADSNTVSVTITVGPVNDAPIGLPINSYGCRKWNRYHPCW
jgi:hypothetical protein